MWDIYLATTTTITAPSLCRINLTNNVLNITDGICRKASQRLYAFGRVGLYIGNDKSKLLLNAVVLSNFLIAGDLVIL